MTNLFNDFYKALKSWLKLSSFLTLTVSILSSSISYLIFLSISLLFNVDSPSTDDIDIKLPLNEATVRTKVYKNVLKTAGVNVPPKEPLLEMIGYPQGKIISDINALPNKPNWNKPQVLINEELKACAKDIIISPDNLSIVANAPLEGLEEWSNILLGLFMLNLAVVLGLLAILLHCFITRLNIPSWGMVARRPLLQKWVYHIQKIRQRKTKFYFLLALTSSAVMLYIHFTLLL